ncbi:hypothetical protein EW145_g2189 [Phellinidium pouzarii]|uniref:Uncharacterized protein n=1 Tax=Phellinidium pouzarii TaxID=167371 RepID=A0A4S4LBS0_9AGAM|nr:hypothetical protein EW145_g2189 [Phellinidium pouzarii]
MLFTKPFLTAATAEKPPPIIPGVEKSRPPVYSPELTALLTSLFSRTGKALKPSHLETPPTLPTRADPASEEARYLGPFSKRREVNIRWRYFTVQSKNILPPLQVSIPHIEEPEGNLESDGEVLRGGFQDTGLLDMVEGLTGSMKHPPKPRRERTAAASSANVVLREDSHSLHGDLSTVVLPTRFLRRRHQQLLGRLPLLTYNRDYKKGKGKYEVSLPKRAVSPRLRYASAPKAMIDADNLAWFRRAQEIEKLKTVRK